MHREAFVAWCSFAFGARQGIFFTRGGMQKNWEVFAHRLITLLRHLLWRSAHHHPVFVFDGLIKQGVPNGTADTENLHGHLAGG